MPSTAFKYLIHKIVLTKVRKPGSFFTFQEFLNIVIYAVMGLALVSFKSVVDVPLSASPATRALPNNATPFPPCAQRRTFLFAPETTETAYAVGVVAAMLSVPGYNCTARGFASHDALLAAFLAEPALQESALSGILFNNATSNLGSYTIAMSRQMVEPDPTKQRDLAWPTVEQLGEDRVAYVGYNDDDSPFLYSGFASIQWAMDRAVAAVGGEANPYNVYVSTGVQVTRFPLQPFTSAYSSGSAGILGFLLPLFACIPAFATGLLLTQFMLNERCYSLVEGMRMMGMSYTVRLVFGSCGGMAHPCTPPPLTAGAYLVHGTTFQPMACICINI